MSFTPNFSISQTALNPALVIATDTSTGSDVLITQRRITLQNANGDYLVTDGITTDYNAWALVTNPISLNLLTEDQAVNITVEWLNISNAVLYSKSQNYCLAYFNKQFLYYLIQMQGLTPGIVQDTNYNTNVGVFWTTIIGAVNAVEIGDDIAASQNSLNRGTQMRLAQNYFF